MAPGGRRGKLLCFLIKPYLFPFILLIYLCGSVEPISSSHPKNNNNHEDFHLSYSHPQPTNNDNHSTTPKGGTKQSIPTRNSSITRRPFFGVIDNVSSFSGIFPSLTIQTTPINHSNWVYLLVLILILCCYRYNWRTIWIWFCYIHYSGQADFQRGGI